jgi:signal transduction histidine kinase
LVGDEANRLQNLLQEILLYAKPQLLQSEELDINQFIEEMLISLGEMPEASERHLEFISLHPEGKVRQNWTTFSSPGFGIANFSFLAGKTSYLLITKLGLLTIKMLVLPRLSNFVQFHWTPGSKIRGDRDKLKQVLINLVRNAYEAIAPGEIVTCKVSQNEDPSFICIAIHNGGNPIPSDILPKLTQPFCSIALRI